MFARIVAAAGGWTSAGCALVRRRWCRLLLAGWAWLSAAGGGTAATDARGNAAPTPLSPSAIVPARDGATVFVACATAHEILQLDPAGAILRRIKVPGPPSGLAISRDGKRLAVTCAAPQSTLCVIDVASGAITSRFAAGHTAIAPLFSADGNTLYICHRFNNEVAFFDLRTRKLLARVAVDREPVAAALTGDGRRLFVANHLHNTSALAPSVDARVTVIDTVERRVIRALSLPNGSDLLLGIALSPDGRHVAVTHNLARFTMPTTQVDRGWMNTAALTLIDAARLEVINTVLLDNLERGAANPWAVGWSGDGQRLVVTHAGTHELSVIDFPGLLAKLEALPEAMAAGQTPDYTRATNVRADVPNDLAFVVGLRERVKLRGNGPRALALVDNTAWVPGYFSDSIDRLDLAAPPSRSVSLALGPPVAMSAERRGEMLFNDATLCFQQWQSCASCHSHDARVDGLNWDLLNDGIGNAKNAKSLLWAHRTPPAMSTGVRDSAETAVRSGVKFILFAVPSDDAAAALDAYLKSLAPIPSPWLESGRLSKAAQRGRKLFESPKVGCAMCHPPGLFTDLQSYDLGLRDRAGGLLDTPTLVEVWRTAPYMHDGSAPTVRDVLLRNPHDQHGATRHLTEREIDDLAAYVLSL